MEFIMVNSNSFGSERNGNTKVSCLQANGLHSKTQLSSPLTAASATHSKNELAQTESGQSCTAQAAEPTPETYSKKPGNDNATFLSNGLNDVETNETKKSLFCSVPLEKIQTILSGYTSAKSDGIKMKIPRKVMCLYCDRTFVNVNLKHKHVERCHSSKQLRRVSLRKHQNFLTSTPCIYCDKFTSTEHTLKDLFKHLVENHSNKYFGCLSCEDRFLNSGHLADHNALCHNLVTKTQRNFSDAKDHTLNVSSRLEKQEVQKEIPVRITRRKQKTKKENGVCVVGAAKVGSNSEEAVKSSNLKTLRNRKLTVKSSRMILKRSKRLQAKLNDAPKKRRAKDANEKKKCDRQDQTLGTKLTEKSTKSSSFINPYPEFDHFFQVKKITDHSIDNLKISSLTFDDVFDKAFFNRIKCNIQENLLHHIDGKLFKNEESESRISNFEKNVNMPAETQNLNMENYGCELSLNAVTPTTLLLSNQFGDDPESQIEYGSKPSKKKTQLKKDEVHYKYFTRRKYQASILEHKENRDLSKLDMWTQYVIKNRQQKILDEKKSPKEILDYFAGDEYKSIMKREELNRILDRRGPFEDLKEEASKKAALDKLNGEVSATDEDNFAEIGELLNDILNRVFELAKDTCSSVEVVNKNVTYIGEVDVPEIPSYLNLRPNTDVTLDNEIDKSDKIALICSSQETENFELPGNTVRGKNEKVELTGEWARSRIYVCAACGLKLQNIKQFLEHKSASHQYIWVQHYEFVGNQSELYRHLSIPVLGKVGVLENTVQCKVWKRSDARLCTKCGKQCNSLGELHRHILECGGDWTWMLARKKYKYRPFGAKSRRKRRGLVKRIYTQKSESSEKKIYKKAFDLPRQKPSDADSIKRMLANLPPKRATRKIICLKDGFNTSRKKQVKTTKPTKYKCGKIIRGKKKEQNTAPTPDYEKTSKSHNNSYRRSLRCLNKVLTSRILDTNSSLIVRRKYTRKIKKEQKDQSSQANKNKNDVADEANEEAHAKHTPKRISKTNNVTEVQNESLAKEEPKPKRCSPRIEKRLDYSSVGDKMNIKHFFPVKKKKKIHIENVKNVNTMKVEPVRKNTLDSPSKKEQKNSPPNSEETKNEDVGTLINLRKRKIHNKNVDLSDTHKTKVRKKTLTNKTRKLKNNHKNISESSTSETAQSQENSKTSPRDFFEETHQDLWTTDTITMDTTASEKNEETQNAFFVKQEEENDKCYTADVPDPEKSVIPDQTTNVSNISIKTQAVKRKLRKPARGLNDCIAMLTSKLGKNFEESTNLNIFNDISSLGHQESIENNLNKKTSEFILKVPFSNEHFELGSKMKNLSEPEKTADNLNSNISKTQTSVLHSDIQENEELSNPVSEDNNVTKSLNDLLTCRDVNYVDICRNIQAKLDINNTLDLQNDDESIHINMENSENTSVTCEKSLNGEGGEEHPYTENVDSIPSQSSLLQKTCNSVDSEETDSDDEIPLSNLLKEEQSDQSTSGKICDVGEDSDTVVRKHRSSSTTENLQETCVELHVEPASMSQETNDSEINVRQTLNHVNNVDKSTDLFQLILKSNEEKYGDTSKTATKDVNVLTEINDNFCQDTENSDYVTATMESNVNKIDSIGRKMGEDKLNDSLFTPSESVEDRSIIDKETPNEEANNFLPLDEQFENNVLSKLDKLSFLMKNMMTKKSPHDALEDESLDMEQPDKDSRLITDLSEYKENSLVLAEGKHNKSRKKVSVSTKCIKIKSGEVQVKDDGKENTNHQRINGNKKSVRSAKAKALESIFDDPLLETSENELVQENSKEVICESLDTSLQKREKLNKVTNKDDAVFEKLNDVEVTSTVLQSESVKDDSKNCSFNENSWDGNVPKVCDSQAMFDKKTKTDVDAVKELRRSARNSKRVTSYNETDLVDPLFDDIDSDKTISKIIRETTKDIFGIKRKNRKLLSNKKCSKNGQDDKKLNGDDLFDLLKTAPNENIVLSKPTNSFFNSFDEISNDFNDDNFDVFGDILEKSMAVIEENLSEQIIPSLTTNISEARKEVNDKMPLLQKQTQTIEHEIKIKTLKKKYKKCKQKKKEALLSKELDYKITSQETIITNEQQNSVDHLQDGDISVSNSNDTSQGGQAKNSDVGKSKIYCDICDKSFSRIESLTKHKRTLTHISKLSELEAKEAALKSKCDELSTNEETQPTNISSDSGKNLNILDMLENIESTECKEFSSPFSVNVNNSNLKLADIINDVLNKPILKKDDDSHVFTDTTPENRNERQPEIRRYKSLAERKSFESENCLVNTSNDCHVKSVDYFENEISNEAAGTILEKQITLLENIIENRTTLNYMDELSVSSTQSVNENVCLEENILDVNISKPVQAEPSFSSPCAQHNNTETKFKENFLKPTQYEEISEDSNLRNYEEQKSRKVLNRDEELFLECCSLLKSGSEVSSYSKNSNNLCNDSNNVKLDSCGQPRWLDTNRLSQKENDEYAEYSSDSSGVRTPLGDSFSQGDSNSATISSQWEMNNSCSLPKRETWSDYKVPQKNLTFEEVFNHKNQKEVIFNERKDERIDILPSFHHVAAEDLGTNLSSSTVDLKQSNMDSEDVSRVSFEKKEFKDASSAEGKKMLTKGAMKVFEGLKVSIPTEELNMDKILTSGPLPPNSPDSTNMSFHNEEDDKVKKSPKRTAHVQGKLRAKTKHSEKHNFQKDKELQMNSKIHDVYDFEETQDNSDVFTKPDFRSFRNTHEKTKKTDKLEGSDDDSQDCLDAVSFDALSSSTSSVSEVLPVKSRMQQNITKKKCMIMGRIFKNAVKSRIIDEDMRNIPVIDNTKLVEDFVLSCPEPVVSTVEKKQRMTEEEMNLAFDNLINNKSNEPKSSSATKSPSFDKLQHKSTLSKRKPKTKNRKRNHRSSDSSDDEFRLQKSSKKRLKKKSNNTEESCINLEQELRECIGVASRKSQRKCTSGKQNVLIEYWSSDESSFETMLERQIVNSAQKLNEKPTEASVQEIELKDANKVDTEKVISRKIIDAEPTDKKPKAASPQCSSNRRKRVAANPLYHWSSSSEDESRDLIEVRPLRDEIEDDEDRPVQHGWIVGDSPKKLVTMLAQAKGKKCEVDSVKEHGKKRTNTFS